MVFGHGSLAGYPRPFRSGVNAERNTIRVTPSLPADWNEAELHHVPLGNTFVDLAPGSKTAAGVSRIAAQNPDQLPSGNRIRGKDGDLQLVSRFRSRFSLSQSIAFFVQFRSQRC